VIGHRLVGKNPNPNLAATLNVASHGATGRFDLTGGDPGTFLSLQSEVAERNFVTGTAFPFGATAVVLAMFNFLW
jgi:hypothetical protein